MLLDGDPDVLDWTQSWHAGQFTLSDGGLVTGIEGWMSVSEAGDLTLSIYDAAAGMPNASAPLFTTTFTVETGPAGWYGVENLDWRLASGAYWISFEPAHTSTLRGVMWMLPPNPLDHYGNSVRGSAWELDPAGPNGLDQVGIRISGVVPEPATWAIMVLGFGTVGASLRRQRSASAR